MDCISEGSDQLLYSRIDDTVHLCEKRGVPCFLGFLDLREQVTTKDYLANKRLNWALYGGYDDAERRLLAIYPDYYEPLAEDYPLCAVGFRYRAVREITHRDVLGTLMAAGIRRDKIGDILCGDGLSVVFLREEIADFVREQIDRIGGEGVTVISEYTGALPVSHTYQELKDTIASPRLDAVVKSLLRISREKAAELIRLGSVSVNHRPVESVSLTLSAPCTVSVRGYGRFLLDEIGPPTKKGRLLLSARKCL